MMPRLAVLLLVLPQILALRTPVVKAPGSRCSRKSIVHAAGLSLFAPGLSLFAPALPANAVEMYSTASSCTAGAICSGSGKTMLAAYDEMLLKRTSEELSEMSEGAPADQVALYKECKRLVSLILELDWKSLKEAEQKLDQSRSSTKKLAAGIDKKDPKITAKAVLEIAEDLDVAAFTSAGTGTPASAPERAANPFDPRLQK